MPSRPISLRFPDGMLERVDRAAAAAGQRRTAWIVAAVEAQLADTPRPTVAMPTPDESPMSAKSAKARAHKVHHRVVASMHQWRLTPVNPPRNAASRAAVIDDARRCLRDAGIEGPIEIELIAWEG